MRKFVKFILPFCLALSSLESFAARDIASDYTSWVRAIRSVDVSTAEQVGTGSIYSLGGYLNLEVGGDDPGSSRTGSFHLNYVNEISPADLGVVDSNLKHADNWNGGVTVNLNDLWSLSVDLDSYLDPTESLTTDGAKVSVGYDFLKLYYRYSRSSIVAPFAFSSTSFEYLGVFLYQHLFGLQVSVDLPQHNTLIFVGEASIFKPSAQGINSLLDSSKFDSVGNFQDTIQNFESWKAGVTWQKKWRGPWDSTAVASLAHLIIQANPLYDFNAAVGYQLNRSFHLQGGAEYEHDPSNHNLIANIELAYHWEKPTQGD